MERLTRPTVKVDETAAKYMAAPGSIPADLRSMNDRLLDLVINGPTLNGVNKDVLRQLIRQLYAALMPYEDTGLEPEQVSELKGFIQGGIHKVDDGWAHVQELLDAEKAGRLAVLPCKVGDQIYAIHQGTTILPMVAKWYETMEGYGDFVLIAHYPPIHKTFRFADFGKTVFLTREDAERALEGGADNA